MKYLIPLCCLVVWSSAWVSATEDYIPGQPPQKSYDQFPAPFLQRYCLDCHGSEFPEADLDLSGLGAVTALNTAQWTSVWAQVALREMPPPEADQPGTIERLQFVDWTVENLRTALADRGGFAAAEDPEKANFVDHALLFGPLPEGIRLLPTASPARLWRVTPQEHMTRLNELINTEPALDPKKPGLRTRGDVVPTNHGGELKLYFGTDRIIKWQGGTVAYATAVKSIPAVLSSEHELGLENYAGAQSVNSAEATQILNMAGDILRYMARGPLSIANPEQITDDAKSYEMVGDIRGLPTSLVYNTKEVRPLSPIRELIDKDQLTEDEIQTVVNDLFERLAFRPPTSAESDTYAQLVRESVDTLGVEEGLVLGLSSLFLDRDALFRPELAADRPVDAHGRAMLQDWELALAVNHALCYIQPDDQLRQAVQEGRMRTRDDVRREVRRMLADETLRKPRIIRFFREYFDYDRGGYICKDARALAETGVSNRGNSHYRAMFDAVAGTDRLIELILSEDQDVLKRLLLTDQVVATGADRTYFGRRRTQEEAAAARKEFQRQEAEAKKREAAELEAWKEANPGKEPPKPKKRRPANVNHNVEEATVSGPRVFARVSRRSFGNGSMKPERTLASAPEGTRLGILTHPSWLVSHSDAMDNHAIRRGRWIRERLLGGGIPDVPITVDAMLPDEPGKTLRERMRVTREDYCWTCHRKMDPLGLPFEMYNHAGLYRTTEENKPVITTGEIIDSGDPDLDGEVRDALELIDRLADSPRVRQVFVRHAFRFWMGRNETLHDRPVLQDAYQAYEESGGSMNAMLESLLTSDAFLYRRPERSGLATSRH